MRGFFVLFCRGSVVAINVGFNVFCDFCILGVHIYVGFIDYSYDAIAIHMGFQWRPHKTRVNSSSMCSKPIQTHVNSDE